MSDKRESRPAENNTAAGVHNVLWGSATNVVQMRDLNGGNVYINPHVVVHPETGEHAPTSSAPPPLDVLVVDDDQDVLDEMVCLLQEDPRIGRVATAADAAEAFRHIRTEAQCDRLTLDAWFLDVCMPGLSGLDLARVGRLFSPPPATVFVTAFDEHAVAAFDLDAVDYLVKPISAARVSRAVDRLYQRGPIRPILRVQSDGADNGR